MGHNPALISVRREGFEPPSAEAIGFTMRRANQLLNRRIILKTGRLFTAPLKVAIEITKFTYLTVKELYLNHAM